MASEYKSGGNASARKDAEESKEESAAASPASPVPVLSDAALQYDTLRAELRASRQSLAQFFERYLR